MGTPIAVTGLGCVGAPGAGLAAQCTALAAGACGLAISLDPALPLAAMLPVARVATVRRHPRRCLGMALDAAREALGAADRQSRREIGLIVGTSTAGLPESESAFFADPPGAHAAYRVQQTHRLTQALAQRLGLGGPQSSHSVACASAACALAEGMEWIRQGVAPAVLVIGVDALTRLTMAGFHSLMLVDAQGCRPLTRGRRGMSLGEGAAALLLEAPERALGRCQAQLLGWGLQADAHHATAPDPQGTQLDAAIAAALADAGSPSIGYVCAHGTGTVDNDAVETAVLGRRFGRVPTASWKHTYGHTLGACAAIEAVGCCLALREQTLWPSGGAGGDALDVVDVLTTARPVRPDAILSTTLAFGGMNAALVIGGAP